MFEIPEPYNSNFESWGFRPVIVIYVFAVTLFAVLVVFHIDLSWSLLPIILVATVVCGRCFFVPRKKSADKKKSR